MTYSEQQIQFAADELMKSIKAIMGGSALTRPWPDSERSRFEELAKRVLDASGIGATLAHVQGSDVAMIELLQKAREERDAAIKEHAHAAIPEGWQPIETAPRDGTEIIGCHSTDWSDIGLAPAIYGPWTMVFARDNWRSSWDRSRVINYMSDGGEIEYEELEAAPTHWMPLLPPPAPETKK